MTILVVLEHDRGQIADCALQAITAGRNLADKIGCDLEALAIGQGAEDLADEVSAYGVGVMHLAQHDLLVDYGADAWAECVVQAAQDVDVEVGLSVGSDRGNEIMAQVAARLDCPFVANCVEVDPGEHWTLARVQWGGSLIETVQLEADLKLLTMAEHSVGPEPASTSSDLDIVEFEPELNPQVIHTMICDREVVSAGIALSTAPIVVGGGRGVGSADGFAALDELASLLGGVVGCSRAVTNNGWRPHSDQVGQTGTRIAPEIYIAAGISGAIQHWVGAKSSKRILAINTDPEANMVTKADYAVIADLHKLVPAIAAEIQKRSS